MDFQMSKSDSQWQKSIARSPKLDSYIANLTQRGPKSTPRVQHRATESQNRLPAMKIVNFNPEGLRSTPIGLIASRAPNSISRYLKSTGRGLKFTTRPQIWRPKTDFLRPKMESYRPKLMESYRPKLDSHRSRNRLPGAQNWLEPEIDFQGLKLISRSPKSISRGPNSTPEG